MRLRDFKTRGIILSKRRQGETDFFVDILSPEFGKFTAIAKGALKITSNFVGKLEMGQEGFFLIHVTNYNYNIIKGIEITSENIVSASTIEDFFCLSKIVELLKKIEFQEEMNHCLYALLNQALFLRKQIDQKHLVSFLKLSILQILGYLPDFRKCSLCRESLESKKGHHTLVGEVYCSSCSSKAEYLDNELSFNQLKILNFIKNQSRNLPAISKLKISPQDHIALEHYANMILSHAVNLKLKC